MEQEVGRADQRTGVPAPSITLERATPADATAIVALRTSAADDLTARFGKGHWSSCATEKGVLLGMKTSTVWVTRRGDDLVATLRLATKKPWAIDVGYFTACKRPLYLIDMAVSPICQRTGIGRRCIEESVRIAREWPADAVRLDAYDADAGAGGFYARCGFREVGGVSYRGTPLLYFEMLL